MTPRMLTKTANKQAFIFVALLLVFSAWAIGPAPDYEDRYEPLTRSGLAEYGYEHDNGTHESWVPCDVYQNVNRYSAQTFLDELVNTALDEMQQQLAAGDIALAAGDYDTALTHMQQADWSHALWLSAALGSETECQLLPERFTTDEGLNLLAQIELTWEKNLVPYVTGKLGDEAMPVSTGVVTGWNEFRVFVKTPVRTDVVDL